MIETPSILSPVDYNDAEHKYSWGSIPYLSATQVVHKFATPFDSQASAERYAAKNGKTAEYWLAEWARKRDNSLVRGNTIHNANEDALNGRMIDMFQGTPLTVHAGSVLDEDPWIERPDGVYLERKLWHHGFRIAGRADKIILTTPGYSERNATCVSGHTRYAHIEDYKTNEKLEKVSYQFKGSGNYKVMKPPIAHIMDSNWWHYQLQLSIYMFMLEYQGFKPGMMTIIHYPHPTEDNPNPKPERHACEYLRKEVVLMLNFLNRSRC